MVHGVGDCAGDLVDRRIVPPGAGGALRAGDFRHSERMIGLVGDRGRDLGTVQEHA